MHCLQIFTTFLATLLHSFSHVCCLFVHGLLCNDIDTPLALLLTACRNKTGASQFPKSEPTGSPNNLYPFKSSPPLRCFLVHETRTQHLSMRNDGNMAQGTHTKLKPCVGTVVEPRRINCRCDVADIGGQTAAPNSCPAPLRDHKRRKEKTKQFATVQKRDRICP